MTEQDPLRDLWVSEQEEKYTMSMTELAAHSTRLHRRVQRRNMIEYLAAGLVIAVFAWMAYVVPVWPVRLGAIMIIAGALYVCWHLNRTASSAAFDANTTADNLAHHHRHQLVRQRDALRSVWRWYLLPFVPGILVFVLGTALQAGIGLPLWASLATASIGLGITGSVFAAVWALNHYAARKLDTAIKTLDAQDIE
jgi:hypothetical protein